MFGQDIHVCRIFNFLKDAHHENKEFLSETTGWTLRLMMSCLFLVVFFFFLFFSLIFIFAAEYLVLSRRNPILLKALHIHVLKSCKHITKQQTRNKQRNKEMNEQKMEQMS